MGSNLYNKLNPPGFNNADMAANDFAVMYNKISIIKDKEYVANIYLKNKRYMHQQVQIGTYRDASVPDVDEQYGERVAVVHTHVAYAKNRLGDILSPADETYADENKVNMYLARACFETINVTK